MKKVQVEELKTKIENSASTVIVQYSGLTVEQMTELRNQLREENIEFKVIKNNISSRAYEMANFADLKAEFTGPTALAISNEYVTAPARVLNNFPKENPALNLKTWTLEKEVSSKEQIMELATLPNKEGMLSMFLSVLEAPIRGLAQVTSQVAEQKED
ncbi:MAG: 50S ribosomal protein L10 [Mycoplasmatales bacterium]